MEKKLREMYKRAIKTKRRYILCEFCQEEEKNGKRIFIGNISCFEREFQAELNRIALSYTSAFDGFAYYILQVESCKELNKDLKQIFTEIEDYFNKE